MSWGVGDLEKAVRTHPEWFNIKEEQGKVVRFGQMEIVRPAGMEPEKSTFITMARTVPNEEVEKNDAKNQHE